jgi:hypothetical protein
MSSSTRRRTTRASAAEDAKKTRDAADFAKKRAPTRGPFVLPGAKDDDDDNDGKKTKCSAWYCAMCDIDEAPEWMIFNRHIRTGYRVRTRWLGATRSIFMAHNETINIWSHLLGLFDVCRVDREDVYDGAERGWVGGAAGALGDGG